jgi:hypothetical protein
MLNQVITRLNKNIFKHLNQYKYGTSQKGEVSEKLGH